MSSEKRSLARGVVLVVCFALLFWSTAQAATEFTLRVPHRSHKPLSLKPRPDFNVPADSYTADYRLLDLQGKPGDFLNVARIGLQGEPGKECQLVIQGVRPGSFVLEMTDKSSHFFQANPAGPLVSRVRVEVFGIIITLNPVNLDSAPLPVNTEVTLTAHLLPRQSDTSVEIRWEITDPKEVLKSPTGDKVKVRLGDEGTYKVQAKGVTPSGVVLADTLELKTSQKGAYINLSQMGKSTRFVGESPNGDTILMAELVYEKGAFSDPQIQWEAMGPDEATGEPRGEWKKNPNPGFFLWRKAFFSDESLPKTPINLTSRSRYGRYFIRAKLV